MKTISLYIICAFYFLFFKSMDIFNNIIIHYIKYYNISGIFIIIIIIIIIFFFYLCVPKDFLLLM